MFDLTKFNRLILAEFGFTHDFKYKSCAHFEWLKIDLKKEPPVEFASQIQDIVKQCLFGGSFCDFCLSVNKHGHIVIKIGVEYKKERYDFS